MSIVGIFTQARPQIAGQYFDAVLEESTELITDVTEFPIETGQTGSDHAVQRPLTITMRVGVSDNQSRAARQSPVTGNLVGAGIGAGLSQVQEELAVAAGLGVSITNAARLAGRAATRSQNALDSIREIQRRNELINVVGAKREYRDCLITNTRQETNKENEQALELVVELRQLIIVGERGPSATLLQPPPGEDNNLASPLEDQGLIVPQPEAA